MLAKIAEMPEPDRTMAGRLHAIITANAPSLAPKLWYGMPAYAREGKVVCYFQAAHKFKTRYATFGFTDAATLDDGAKWPVAFALKVLTPGEEAQAGNQPLNRINAPLPALAQAPVPPRFGGCGLLPPPGQTPRPSSLTWPGAWGLTGWR